MGAHRRSPRLAPSPVELAEDEGDAAGASLRRWQQGPRGESIVVPNCVGARMIVLHTVFAGAILEHTCLRNDIQRQRIAPVFPAASRFLQASEAGSEGPGVRVPLAPLRSDPLRSSRLSWPEGFSRFLSRSRVIADAPVRLPQVERFWSTIVPRPVGLWVYFSLRALGFPMPGGGVPSTGEEGTTGASGWSFGAAGSGTACQRSSRAVRSWCSTSGATWL